MTDFIYWFVDFAIQIFTMIGIITLFIAWGYYSDNRHEKLDQEGKKKTNERRGIILGIVILIFILLTIWASLSSIFV